MTVKVSWFSSSPSSTSCTFQLFMLTPGHKHWVNISSLHENNFINLEWTFN